MEEKIKRKNPITLKGYLSQFSKEQLIAQIIDSMTGMFRDACRSVQANGLLNLFEERAEKIMNDTYDIGWGGFHDEVADIYYNYFPQ